MTRIQAVSVTPTAARTTNRRDARLDGDDLRSAVSDREADVDGGDQGDGEGVNGREVQPPEADWYDDVGYAEHEPPEDRRSEERVDWTA